MSLPQDTLEELRNAPCIGSRHLFEPTLVQRINEQQVARANDSVAMRAYMTHTMAPKAPKTQWSVQPQSTTPSTAHHVLGQEGDVAAHIQTPPTETAEARATATSTLLGEPTGPSAGQVTILRGRGTSQNVPLPYQVSILL